MHSFTILTSNTACTKAENVALLTLAVLFQTLPGISGESGETDMVLGVEKTQSDEERLFEYLFTDYNPSARPVLNSSKTVNVTLMFSLMHIQELVSKIHGIHISLPMVTFKRDL